MQLQNDKNSHCSGSSHKYGSFCLFLLHKETKNTAKNKGKKRENETKFDFDIEKN